MFVAPTGTDFPEIDDAEGSFDAAWVKLGAEGSKNYEESGVTVTHSQTIETFTGAGSTAPRKAFRTEEGLVLGFTLVDLSAEQYAEILDDASVTTTAAGVGEAGKKEFSLLRGLGVQQYALLGRGESTEDNELNLQYQWPTVYQSGEPAPAYAKGDPAALEVEFTALEVVAGEFGELHIQTDAPSS